MEGLATGKDSHLFVTLNNPAFIQPTFQVLYAVRLSPRVAAALQESNTGNYRISGIEDGLDKSIRQRRPLTTGRRTVPIVAPARLLPSARAEQRSHSRALAAVLQNPEEFSIGLNSLQRV